MRVPASVCGASVTQGWICSSEHAASSKAAAVCELRDLQANLSAAEAASSCGLIPLHLISQNGNK